MISAFITKRKRPRVTTVIGSVSKTRMGFTIAFKQANTNAKIIAVVIFEICTPDKILASTYAMMPEIKRRRMKFMLMGLRCHELNEFARINTHYRTLLFAILYS